MFSASSTIQGSPGAAFTKDRRRKITRKSLYNLYNLRVILRLRSFVNMATAEVSSFQTRGSQEPISLTWDTMQLNGSDDIYLTWRQLGKHIKTLQEITSYWNRHIALMVPSCSSNQITPWYQFSLKSDKVNILSMAAILKKKMAGWK